MWLAWTWCEEGMAFMMDVVVMTICRSVWLLGYLDFVTGWLFTGWLFTLWLFTLWLFTG